MPESGDARAPLIPKEIKGRSWIDTTVARVGLLKREEIFEAELPKDVDYRVLVAALGRPSRDHEIGGLIDPVGRSVKIVGGYAVGEDARMNPHTSYMPPREKPDGTVDDIMFHTHPWNESDPIRIFKTPINSVYPSPTDIDSLLATKQIEVDSGIVRPPSRAIVSSRGYLCEMEAEGVHYDEPLLREKGFTDEQLLAVKQMLSLAPPAWVGNTARGDAERNQLVAAIDDFYQRKSDHSVSFSEKMEELERTVEGLVRDRRTLDMLVKGLVGHFPKYPTSTYLHNTGFSDDQIPVVQSMFGYKQEIFQVSENGEMTKVE